MISIYNRVEHNVGKIENAAVTCISPFLTMFYKVIFLKVIKSWDCVVKG